MKASQKKEGKSFTTPDVENWLLFTGRIFLSGYARQEASGVRPMWKTGQKQSYKRA